MHIRTKIKHYELDDSDSGIIPIPFGPEKRCILPSEFLVIAGQVGPAVAPGRIPCRRAQK